MTKYGHESGSIAISRLPAGIDDKIYIVKKCYVGMGNI